MRMPENQCGIGMSCPGEVTSAAIGLGDGRTSECESGSAAATGEIDSFQPVFERWYGPVLSFIYHLVDNRGLAEELAQETLTRGFFRLQAKGEETRIGTFLFGIARNIVREEVKRRYRSGRISSLEQEREDPGDSRPAPDKALLDAELAGAIRKAVARLPEDRRVGFVLKVFCQMGYQEIAAITGSSIGKLKTDVHRARLQLRRDLEPLLPAGDSEVRE